MQPPVPSRMKTPHFLPLASAATIGPTRALSQRLFSLAKSAAGPIAGGKAHIDSVDQGAALMHGHRWSSTPLVIRW